MRYACGSDKKGEQGVAPHFKDSQQQSIPPSMFFYDPALSFAPKKEVVNINATFHRHSFDFFKELEWEAGSHFLTLKYFTASALSHLAGKSCLAEEKTDISLQYNSFCGIVTSLESAVLFNCATLVKHRLPTLKNKFHASYI